MDHRCITYPLSRDNHITRLYHSKQCLLHNKVCHHHKDIRYHKITITQAWNNNPYTQGLLLTLFQYQYKMRQAGIDKRHPARVRIRVKRTPTHLEVTRSLKRLHSNITHQRLSLTTRLPTPLVLTLVHRTLHLLNKLGYLPIVHLQL